MRVAVLVILLLLAGCAPTCHYNRYNGWECGPYAFEF